MSSFNKIDDVLIADAFKNVFLGLSLVCNIFVCKCSVTVLSYSCTSVAWNLIKYQWAVKYFRRMSWTSRQSRSKCFNVNEASQDAHIGWSSPDNRQEECVKREWPTFNLLMMTASRREMSLLWWGVPTVGWIARLDTVYLQISSIV